MQRIARLDRSGGGEVGDSEGSHLLSMGLSPSPDAGLQIVVNLENRSDQGAGLSSRLDVRDIFKPSLDLCPLPPSWAINADEVILKGQVLQR